MQFWIPVFLISVFTVIGVLGRPAWPGEISLSLLPQIGLFSVLLGALLIGMGRPTPGLLLLALALICVVNADGMFGRKAVNIENPLLRIIWINSFSKTDSFRRALNQAENENADIVIIAEAHPSLEWNIISSSYPLYRHARGAIMGENTAISVISKRPIEIFEIVEVSGRKSAVFKILIDETPLSIGAVHPTIPATPGKLQQRNAHILKTAEKLRASENRLLLGDFNTVPWSPVIKELSAVTGQKRLIAAASSTWISKIPFLGLPIDLVFVSENIDAQLTVGQAVGSDHFPLILDIRFTSKEQRISESPYARYSISS